MEEDHKSAHLDWIKNHSDFIPRNHYDFTESYFNIMKQIYSHPLCSQAYAENCYTNDLNWVEEKEKIRLKLLQKLKTSSRHFVTIGFNHQIWSIKKCVEVIQTIMSFDWITKGKAVFELHRINGEHPHCHILFESILPKSKILEKIWATKGIKKVVLSKSFIDYKSENHNHQNYINGQKTDEKMKYVQMDQNWRESNDIPQFFEK